MSKAPTLRTVLRAMAAVKDMGRNPSLKQLRREAKRQKDALEKWQKERLRADS